MFLQGKSNGKAQATIEYLIILAVVIVIVLVVVNYLPNLIPTTQISEQEARIYWQTALPLSITDFEITSTGASIVLKNQTNNELTVSDLKLDGVSIGVDSTKYNAGQEKKLAGAGTGVKCTAGERFSFEVLINYSTEFLPDRTLIGQKKIVGTCSS